MILNSLYWNLLDFYIMTSNIFCLGHDIVASFKLTMQVYLLQDNILQLQEDIFNEIPFPNIKVLAVSFLF